MINFANKWSIFGYRLALIGICFALLLAGLLQVGRTIATSLITTSYYLPIITNPSPYDWLQFNGGETHSGSNTHEQRISVDNAGELRLLFQVLLPAVADGAPVYLSNVNTTFGVRNLLFMTTRDGRIVALDAYTGMFLWSKQYGPNGCLINNNHSRNEACYTTSSPAIDPNRMFVYSYGFGGYVHK